MHIRIDHIRQFFSTCQPVQHNDSELIRAGVLIPLFERDGELHVILTRRTDEVEHHKGQISFPGGVMDETDVTVTETALREAEEEIGLKRKDVETLGMLDDFPTPSGFCITPVAAYLPLLPAFSLNKSEVLELFDVPLSFFLDSRNERMEQRERAGKMLNVYFYRYQNYEIWGATAAILRSFLHSLVDQFEHNKE